MLLKAKLSNTSNESDRIDSKYNTESSFYMYEMPQVLSLLVSHRSLDLSLPRWRR